MNSQKYRDVEFALSVISGRIPAVYPQPDSWYNKPMAEIIGDVYGSDWTERSEEEKREYIIRKCEQEILFAIFPFRD